MNIWINKCVIHWRIQGGAPGTRPPGVQILSFSCSFRQKNWKIIALLGVGAPPGENPGSATVIDRKYWYIDQMEPKNVQKKSPTHHWKMSHLPIYKNLQITRWDIFQWQVGYFCFVFSIFWFNLINIPIFSIYYTYICSNINNLSEKELKTPQKPIFLKLILKPWVRLGITPCGIPWIIYGWQVCILLKWFL